MKAAALQCRGFVTSPAGRGPGIDLEVEAGAVYGLFGPAGTGKTLLLRALAGLQRPPSGDCLVLGLPSAERGLAVRRRLGFLPQSAGPPPWMDATDAGRLAGGLHPSWDPGLYRELLETLDVPPDRPAAALGHTRASSLGLALALAHRPHALLLDEPYASAPSQTRRRLLEPVLEGARSSGMAVLFASRRADELDGLLDRIGVLDRRRLLADSAPAELAAWFHRAVVAFPAGPPAEIRIDGVLRVQVDAGGLVFDLEGRREELAEQLSGLGPSDVSISPLPLGDCVAAVLDAGRREGGA